MSYETSFLYLLDTQSKDLMSINDYKQQDVCMMMLDREVVYKSYSSKDEAVQNIKKTFSAAHDIPLGFKNSDKRSVYLICKHGWKFRPHRKPTEEKQSVNEGKSFA